MAYLPSARPPTGLWLSALRQGRGAAVGEGWQSTGGGVVAACRAQSPNTAPPPPPAPLFPKANCGVCDEGARERERAERWCVTAVRACVRVCRDEALLLPGLLHRGVPRAGVQGQGGLVGDRGPASGDVEAAPAPPPLTGRPGTGAAALLQRGAEPDVGAERRMFGDGAFWAVPPQPRAVDRASRAGLSRARCQHVRGRGCGGIYCMDWHATPALGRACAEPAPRTGGGCGSSCPRALHVLTRCVGARAALDASPPSPTQSLSPLPDAAPVGASPAPRLGRAECLLRSDRHFQ
jgi:hypothetical protein